MKTLSLEVSTYLRLCQTVDTPRSLACYLLAKNEQWIDLFELPAIKPGKDFRDDYLVSEFLKKNADLPLGIDRASVAMQKFIQSETQCSETNKAFLAYSDGSAAPPEFLRDVRYWVNRILGNLSQEKLKSIEQHCRFGPGATSACRGADVLPSLKYASDMHTTLRLRPFVSSLMGINWSTTPFGEVIVNDVSRTTTVPKNARTDRTICVEPHANVFVQLGIGKLIREQLTRFGILLDTQEWSRFLAQKAWSWRLATIDLSSASDTVAYNVVKYVMPGNWFRLLDMARVDMTRTSDGSVIHLEKFSSMGNGYTFELETLLFVACAMASGADRRLLSVYGDDIIVEQQVASGLIENLTLLGFKVNTDKTFVDGDFYESCGADFYRGHAVRPVYARGSRSSDDGTRVTHDERCFLLANNLRRWATTQIGDHFVTDSRLLPPWLHVVQRASRLARMTKIPDGVGDEGFVRAFDECGVPDLLNRRRKTAGWFGYAGRTFTRMQKISKRSSQTGGYLASLHALERTAGRQTDRSRRKVEILNIASARELGWLHELSSNDEFSLPEPVRGGSILVPQLRDTHVWHWVGVGPW